MPSSGRKGLCVVCLKTFDNIHEHHVYPQAYGGKDGPVVELCPTHHTDIHNTATAFIAAQMYGKPSPPPWQNISDYRRALQYIKVIVQCGLAARQNGSHTYKITLDLTADERRVLEELKIRLGTSSLEKAVRKSLHLTYRTLTGKTKFI